MVNCVLGIEVKIRVISRVIRFRTIKISADIRETRFSKGGDNPEAFEQMDNEDSKKMGMTGRCWREGKAQLDVIKCQRKVCLCFWF